MTKKKCCASCIYYHDGDDPDRWGTCGRPAIYLAPYFGVCEEYKERGDK